MKILLDENLPHALRLLLQGHDVYTVAYLGWSGTKNGALLQLAAEHGFDVMITLDKCLARALVGSVPPASNRTRRSGDLRI